MSLFQKFFLSKPNFASSEKPVITLLYDELPVDRDLRAGITNLEAGEPLDDPTSLELEVEQWWNPERNLSLLATLRFDHHVIEIAGINAPVPAAAQDHTIWASHWRQDLKELMASHKANIILQYTGKHTDPIEQHIALYKATQIFSPMGQLGVLNEPGWCCHPADILPNLVAPEMLPIVRDSPPLLYWTGFILTQAGEYDWFMSRGHHLFQVADFAFCLGEYDADPQDVQNIFHELFLYAYYNQTELKGGDIVAVDEDRAYEMYDLEAGLESLEGVGDMLIVHALSPEEQDAIGRELDGDMQFFDN